MFVEKVGQKKRAKDRNLTNPCHNVFRVQKKILIAYKFDNIIASKERLDV